MTSWRIALVPLFVGILLGGTAEAGSIVNGSFEDNQDPNADPQIDATLYLPGWMFSTSNDFKPVQRTIDQTSYDGSIDYQATDGVFYAYLTAGLGQGVASILTQDFRANAGDILSFDIFFSAGDQLPNNDYGYATIVNLDLGSTPISIFYSDVSLVGDYGSTPWTSINFTIPTTARYEFQVGVANQGDNAFPSYLGLDNVALTSSDIVGTPEPSTLFSVVVALGIGMGWRSRKRSTQAQI